MHCKIISSAASSILHVAAGSLLLKSEMRETFSKGT